MSGEPAASAALASPHLLDCYEMYRQGFQENLDANVTIIAVWDGEASADGFGGTKDLLQKASELGARVVVIPTLLLQAQDSR